MFKALFIVLAVLAVAFGLLLGSLNSEPVTLDLLIVQLHWPLGLVAMVILCCGILLGVVGTWLLAVLPLRFSNRKIARIEPASSTEAEMPVHD